MNSHKPDPNCDRSQIAQRAFDSECWSCAQLIYDLLNAEPLSHNSSAIFVNLPSDIIDRIGLSSQAHAFPIAGFSYFKLSMMKATQYEQLWEYSAAFNDCCLTIGFDDSSNLDRLLTDGLFQQNLRSRKRSRPETLIAPPINALFSCELLHDGYVLDVAHRLPFMHKLAVWHRQLDSESGSAKGEIHFRQQFSQLDWVADR